MVLHPEVMEEVAPSLGLGAGQDSLRRGRRHSNSAEVGGNSEPLMQFIRGMCSEGSGTWE